VRIRGASVGSSGDDGGGLLVRDIVAEIC